MGHARHNLVLGYRARKAFFILSVVKYQQVGDSQHIISGRNNRAGLYIHFPDPDAAPGICCKLIYDRTGHLTGRSAGRPAIEQDR